VTVPGLLGLAVLTAKSGGPMVLVPESDPSANITHHTYNDVLPLLMGQYLGPGLLGLGVTEPLPSWGNLLRGLEDFSLVAANPWRIFPLLLLILAVTSFQLILPSQEEIA